MAAVEEMPSEAWETLERLTSNHRAVRKSNATLSLCHNLLMASLDHSSLYLNDMPAEPVLFRGCHGVQWRDEEP
ncbi:unnamed protein product [Arctogadus glacialis]